MTDEQARCLITCITTDDDGRGYYCEWCPDLSTRSTGGDE